MNNYNPETLTQYIKDAHERTLALIDGLDEQQLMGPILPTVNPLRWEIAHTSYFYSYFLLRSHAGLDPVRADEDELFNSMTINHDERWDLPLPSMQETWAYIQAVHDQTKSCLAGPVDPQRDYLAEYAVYHHDMHNEAFTYTRQTLNYPAPDIAKSESQILNAGALPGDVNIPGGEFTLGAQPEDGFVFDNEKWGHTVQIKPFKIARAAVSNADFLEFVEDGGYQNKEYWSDEGWNWRLERQLECPVYWRKDSNEWQIKQFQQWNPLPLNAALIHVSWYEANAFCHWAGRRLPTEAEWEVAAAALPTADGKSLSQKKRRYPWGDELPQAHHANLDGYALGTVDVAAHAAGDSAFGCRQMIGNVWEWTQDVFNPYPGFEPDMYQDYSQPLFGITRVLRGGAWPTRGRMIRNTWRTYYGPDRNDVFAGFRTCAL